MAVRPRFTTAPLEPTAKLRTGHHHAPKAPALGRARTAAPGPDAGLCRLRTEEGLRSSSCLPSGGSRRRDVLFFTQELSTLLNSGVPLDRALSITSELTTKPQFRDWSSAISCAPSKAANRWPMRSRCIPLYFSDLFINMVRAGEASGSLGQIFERLSEFERSRDELRSYIISSMIYPALLAMVGAGSIFVLLDFVVPRFASVFDDSRMKIPVPTQIMLEASKIVQDWGWVVALAIIGIGVAFRVYTRTPRGPPLVG